MTVMIQDTAEQKVIPPTFYTMRLVGNELFAIYMNYPQGYGFNYDFAAELTLFMLLEFTLGPIWVWIFVNEVPTSWTLIGGSVVIIAVLFKSGLEILKGNP